MAKEVLEMEVKSNIGELSKDTQAIIEAIIYIDRKMIIMLKTLGKNLNCLSQNIERR